MNTSLVIRTREHLEEIKTELEYIDVFPQGILKAGMEILNNPNMTVMAKRTIFQLGLYQNRECFLLNDLYGDLMMLDMRYKLSSGDTSDIEAGMTFDELHQLKNVLNDLKENSFDWSLARDEYLVSSLRLVYEIAKREIDHAMHADSMFAICKLALKLGYRIIMEDGDLNSFGAGVFKNLFKPESLEDRKSAAIVSRGLTFKVILNDPQSNFSQSDPIINRIKQAFPEAEAVSLNVQKRY